MSDDIQLQWKVTTMDCYPNFSGEKDYVFNVHWDCLTYYSGISGGPFYGRTYSVNSVPINTGNFTPYDDLKQEQVLEWIWNIIGISGKNDYETASKNQIYSQLNPPVIQPPIPWTPEVFPVIAPEIITQPVENLTLWSGVSGYISVQAIGQPLNYSWKFNNEVLSGINSPIYTFADLQPNQSGVYNVEVFNSLGKVLSSGCNLNVMLPYAPNIDVQPQNIEGNYLSNATLQVVASAYPYPNYQWRKNGENLSGYINKELTFTLDEKASGNYDVIVSNYLGQVISNEAVVTVNMPQPDLPVIINQPQNYSTVESGFYQFYVNATGYPNISYQWKKDGTDLSNETGIFLTNPCANISDSGIYNVSVYNSFGSVLSNDAVLTVYSGIK